MQKSRQKFLLDLLLELIHLLRKIGNNLKRDAVPLVVPVLVQPPLEMRTLIDLMELTPSFGQLFGEFRIRSQFPFDLFSFLSEALCLFAEIVVEIGELLGVDLLLDLGGLDDLAVSVDHVSIFVHMARHS